MRIFPTLLGLMLSLIFCQPASAAITFRIESASLESDGINPTIGVVDVYLDVDGVDVGRRIANWQSRVVATNFTGSISEITFGTATNPVNHVDLFPDSNVQVSDPEAPGALGSSDFFDDSGPTLFDQAGLMSFSFSVAAGQTGTFTLSFATGSPSNAISDTTFAALEFSSIGSLVNVSAAAVPEPGSFAVCGLVVAGFAARQRRKAKKNKLQTV